MANGTTRLAQTKIVLRDGRGTDELMEEKSLNDQKVDLPRIPLKAGKSDHNHSFTGTAMGNGK